MKLLILSVVLLSICFELNHGRCVKNYHSNDCPSARVFTPHERPIHYIYQGESCNCPKYHDVIVEQPQFDEKVKKPCDYEFKVNVPEIKSKEEEKIISYMFDVHIEKPVEKSSNQCEAYDYKIQQAPEKPISSEKNSIRYIYDTHVEQPVKPCAEKPWKGLVAQIDTIVLPNSNNRCNDPSHTPESCNCGCRNTSHTPATCDCHNNNIFNYSLNESVKRIKRDTENKKSKRREIKFPKIKKIDPKELSALLNGKLLRQKSKKIDLPLNKAIRPKRREDSPCSYSFESCDPKRKTPTGCPLCYKCKCEPADDSEDQKFSSKHIRIPYKIVKHDRDFMAPTQQEFDYEPSAYTGLKKPDMYKQYIEQIISKYPEHMARKMPDMQEQQRDLLNFINELAKNDKSPQGNFENEDEKFHEHSQMESFLISVELL
ncbi:hypothetical protein PVAND_011847 [Polypedilum vanderplanki]|uniref:Uncharacterized protein n=1 Tax=Polypedilum vanderplanki TaxID=319348 RepID=A0A9J6CJU9_POLVA|nr:hypothetical protein PVAND_011847 [Polypedilum vanderplanki]